ncbi:MAG: DUF4012 domain-containing protein [Ilumatobacter sp.]
MTEVRFKRRNRVDERYAGAIAVVAGLVSLLSPASPTGSTVTDAIVLLTCVGVVTWASASAQWWALTGVAGIAAAIALDPMPAVLAFLAFLAGVHVGLFRRDDTEIRAVAGGVAVNVLLWSQLGGFLGLSAIVGITASTVLLVLGIRRRPSRTRRTAWQGLGIAGALLVVGLIGVAVAGLNARTDVTEAARTARAAVNTLNSGDYQTAAGQFEEAASAFERSDGQLGGPLALGGRLVPGVAQNLEAARVLSDVAALATQDAASALRQIDPELLRLSAGRIDTDAIAALEQPLVQVQEALFALESGADRVRSPWLLGQLQDQLDDLQVDVDKNAPLLQNSIDAVRFAPGLLGADGERRYLVLFTSPSEARNSVGFFGNWAELVISNGRFSVERFGRTSELNSAIAQNGSDCDGCPEEFLLHYGINGFTTGENGTVGNVPWSNVTIPAHFPYAAATMASMYPDSGGQPIDGVIAMDPYVLAQLMEYTGPIEVPELDATVAAADAAEFLLIDQYAIAESKRIRVEALDTIGLEAIQRILSAQLPDPPELARAFGPLVEERRLVMWATDRNERAFFNRIGMLGAIPPVDPVDGGFSVAVTNGSANKIDSFLDRSTTITERIDADGTRRLIADVTLTNNAPTTGFPDYVIGSGIDLPNGTSRLIVTFYGATPIDVATRDGMPLSLGPITEAGWFGYRTGVDLASGESTSYRLEFVIAVDDDDTFEPATWEQPLRR